MEKGKAKRSVSVVTDTEAGIGAKVILFNDNVHTFDEVTQQLFLALLCTEEEAFAIAYQAHTEGSAVAYQGHMERCLWVSSVLGEIQLHTQVSC